MTVKEVSKGSMSLTNKLLYFSFFKIENIVH